MGGTISGGPTVRPGDPRFANVTRGFNQRWIAHPDYVRVCSTPDDVVEAVQDALRLGLRLTVRGGGHCYENFVYGNDGGVIVDLTPMNGVYHDASAGWFVIEAGATLFDVYAVLDKQYGVTIPGGSCYSVGAGGHITGGGYGLLSRLHGLTVDHLTAVEVVHVDDQGAVHRDVFRGDTGDHDEWLMLWGNKGGGGGNFGIVTKFFFAGPPPAPSEACLVSEAYPWSGFDLESFTAFLQGYGQFFVDHKDPGPDGFEGLFAMLHLTCQPAPQIVVTAQVVGDDPAALHAFRDLVRPDGVGAEPVVKPVGYHGIPSPTTDVQVMPWLFVTQTLNGSGNPQRGKYGSAYMIGNFTIAECETLYRNLRQLDYANDQALLQVDSYGGQINAVAPDATAIPQRSSALKLQYQTYWQDEADDSANLGWFAEFYGQMYGPNGPMPDGRLDGCYVNYPDANLNLWQTLYYKQNYDQLQQVKARWDPLNVFNHAQSIELPQAMGGVFVSYRRDDSAYIAGRLRDDLAEQFGDGLVIFRDIEAMPLGPFPDEIARAVADCDAMLVVIGDRWLAATDAAGNRRLDDGEDWVRREIVAALQQGKVVVPVLVEGARLPAVGELPGDMAGLARQQAVELPDARWDYELGRLADQLRVILGVPAGVRVLSGPWTGPEAPVRITVDKVEVRPAGMRFDIVVDNATTDELFLPPDTFDVTDDTGHQYPPAEAHADWPTDVAPGSCRGSIEVGDGLQPGATVLQAGWVRALGTFEVASVYATVPLTEVRGRGGRRAR